MNTNSKHQIKFNDLEKDFKEHLNLHNNSRILFTSPYGQGKSTFLKEFFEDEYIDFTVIKLFPVNYSISPNEDIFELIKFDIVTQLMVMAKDYLEKEDFSILLTSQVFVKERFKANQLTSFFLSALSMLGKTDFEIIDLLMPKLIDATARTSKNWWKFHKKAQIDEEKKLSQYLRELQGKTGQPYEMDAISILISNLISRIKGHTKTVLLIDDLDRLDPEHIFRLFNIFSGHFDIINGESKFGFDKTIFVCDIDNIHNIFSHRYGMNVDFKGYVDKFYSLVPFHFDSKTFIMKEIYSLLQSLTIDKNKSDYIVREILLRDENGDMIYKCFEHLVLTFIDANFINLRSLQQTCIITNKELLTEKNNNSAFNVRDYPILWIFFALKDLVGSWDLLDEKIKILSDKFDNSYIARANKLYTPSIDSVKTAIIEYCIPFNRNGVKILHKEEPTKGCCLKLSDIGVMFEYEYVRKNMDSNTCSIKLNEVINLENKGMDINLNALIVRTYRQCRSKRILTD